MQQRMEFIDITKITISIFVEYELLLSRQLTLTTGQRARMVK